MHVPWFFKYQFLMAALLGIGLCCLHPSLSYGQEVDKAVVMEEESAFTLGWPLGCTLHEDCFIKNYPDLKTGIDPITPVDYKCGERTAPGLKGTEVMFIDYTTARNSQPVLAAADGRVLFLEDGLKDSRRYSKAGKKACGNYVVVRHSGVYSTKYCHLRQGSAAVQVGQKVTAGEVLAEVGSSGATEHPKLYFELQKNGDPTDPFTSRPLTRASACFALTDKSLWQENIPYLPAGIIAASFSANQPTPTDLDFNLLTEEDLPKDIPEITAWIKVFGILKGDRESLKVYTPTGKIWHQAKRRHPTAAPFWVAMLSARPQGPLAEGEWKAHYTLEREGEEILSHTFMVAIVGGAKPVAHDESDLVHDEAH